jgi:uncharacterized protein involved in exopolysaccharide biosynthesis
MTQYETPPSLTEISLKFATHLLQNLKWILLTTTLLTTCVVLLTYLIPKKYTSEAIIYIPEDGKSNLLKNLPGASNFSGLLDLNIGSQPNSDIILTILQTKDLHEKILWEFDFLKKYELDSTKNPNWLPTAINQLKKNLYTSKSDENAISISFKDTSAVIAKNVLDRILQITDSTYISINKERSRESKKFFEQRLKKSDSTLRSVQDSLSLFQNKYGIIDPDIQTEQAIKVISELEAKRTMLSIEKEIEITRNGEMSFEINQYDNAIKKIESEIQSAKLGKNSGNNFSIKNNSRHVIQFYNLLREIKIQENINNLIRQNYESNILEENKDIKNIVIIQKPWINPKKVSPPRAAITLSFFIICFLSFTTFSFIINNIKKQSQVDPQLKEALNLFLKKLHITPKNHES